MKPQVPLVAVAMFSFPLIATSRFVGMLHLTTMPSLSANLFAKMRSDGLPNRDHATSIRPSGWLCRRSIMGEGVSRRLANMAKSGLMVLTSTDILHPNPIGSPSIKMLAFQRVDEFLLGKPFVNTPICGAAASFAGLSPNHPQSLNPQGHPNILVCPSLSVPET